MKKSHTSILFILLAGLYSCFKEDRNPPVIFLDGSASVYVTIGTPYIDPGITAKDDRDGDITYLIEKTGEINTELTGEYPIKFNVVDASGNIAHEVVRHIYVRHRNYTLEGIYLASCECKNMPIDTAAYYTTISSSILNQDEIIVSNILNSQPLDLNGFLSGNTSQKISFQTKNYADTLYYGSGTIDSLGLEINLSIYKQTGTIKDTCYISLKK